MTLYVILGLAAVALYFVIRGGAKSEIRADNAEAQVKEITKTIEAVNEIEATNSKLTDEQLDSKLFGSGKDQ